MTTVGMATLGTTTRATTTRGTTTLALDRYDRLFPFHDRTVEVPDGLALEVLQVGQENVLRDGAKRHERMLRHAEFDAAEVSLSSYIAAVARGMAFTAIPAFPRRLFSAGQLFVNAATGITHPRELAGRRVGLQSFQTTLAVLAKGDLAVEYGLELKDVNWVLRQADTVDVAYADGFRVERLAAGDSMVEALADGRLDAMFYSRTPWRDPRDRPTIRRLFEDPAQEEAQYYQRNGYWPIMHVVAIRSEAVERQPGLPALLMRAFESAAGIADSYLDDPGWSRLAWTKYTREREAAGMGANLWPLGVAANRANLERFIGYSHAQGIIDRVLKVDDLFHPSVRES